MAPRCRRAGKNCITGAAVRRSFSSAYRTRGGESPDPRTPYNPRMASMVKCVKLEREAEGLAFPPYPRDLGKRIWENVSKEAWAQGLKHQTILENGHRLNLADPKARNYPMQQSDRDL